MILRSGLLVILVVSSAFSHLQRPENPNNREDFPTREREKRGVLFPLTKILREILEPAKRYYSNGIDTVFLKPGGFHKAKEDFRRARPIGVRTTDENGVLRRKGYVGDWRVILQHNQKQQSTTLTMQMHREQLNKYHGDKIILYVD